MYPSSNVTDGNQGSYWESANNTFPQWVQADLGSARSASRVVLQLPAGWGARTQTLTLGGSTDGTTFTILKSSAAHTFDPSTRNTVALTFPAATRRYFRVTITANSGWPAGQVSEFQNLELLTPFSPRCRRTPRPAAPPCARPGAGCSLMTTH
ncbi:discoidin domain-containing protein [Streptomyces mirabilis]|uniref:discoidin domain-containing protein n=1 Tax=Streptomyces mirabilis TaxID=68239 RepID=UPI003666ADC5